MSSSSSSIMPSMKQLLLVLVWFTISGFITLTSATTNTPTFNPNYRVRGVVSRTRHERALQASKVVSKDKSVKEKDQKFKDRTYNSNFLAAESVEEEGGEGRSEVACAQEQGVQSGDSKAVKARSGEAQGAAARSKKGKSPSAAAAEDNGEAESARSATKEKKMAKGASGLARSGECGSAKLKSEKVKGGKVKSASKFQGTQVNGPDREYPPNIMAATSADVDKKGKNKGEKGASKMKASGAEGCARDGTSKEQKSKFKGRTRGLKKTGSKEANTEEAARSDECVESAFEESSDKSAKFAKDKSGKSKSKDKSQKAKSAAFGEPVRAYPEYTEYTGSVEQTPIGVTVKEPKGGEAKATPKGDTFSVSGGVTAPGDETVLLASSSPVDCKDIADGEKPEGENLVKQYDISADMAIDTTQTTIEDFYVEFRQYLQREVALEVAECETPKGPIPSNVTGVVFEMPYDNNKGCQATGALMESQPTEAYDFADKQENNIAKTAHERQGTAGKEVNTVEYPTATIEEYPATTATATATTAYGEGDPASAGASAFAVATGNSACYHVVVPVNIYLTPDATKQDVNNAKYALQDAINEANMDVILGVANGEVSEIDSFSASSARASLATDYSSSGKKIGFSLGMLGIILVSLTALKMAFNRKRKAQQCKDPYASMRDEIDDQPDDTTFAYPSEDDLLGPEFGDLDFEEAYHNHHQRKRKHGDEPKSSAYILEDLQDGLSVETGSSYASSKHEVSYRKVVPPTPDHRKGCC